MTLIQQLVKKGILTEEKASVLEFTVKNSNRKEEDVIMETGLLPEDILFGFKSEILKIPLQKVDFTGVSLKTLELIPEETAKYYHMIPLQKTEKILEIGMVYPEDLKTQEALKFLARQGKFTYKVVLITLTDCKNLLKQYRNLKKEVGMALEELETELKEEKIEVAGGEFARLAEEAPVTKIVAVILRHAVEGLASDIHIEPTKDKLRVRFRSLGELHASILLPLKVHLAVVARIKILADLKIDETRMPQDGRFSAKIDEKYVDFRVSTFPTTLGEKVVIRILDPTTGLKSFEHLGLEDRNLKVVQEAAMKPYGLILSTGPTGSGKTTTLYAILQLLNEEGVNIITLEDPVEYFMEGINQSQVKPDIGYTFPTGLRHILRQDPDIIMVGEIRDEEAASLAIQAALTGHIVLSTLHTNNAVGVIPRLIDMGIKPYLIPPTLQLAIAQRLVRSLCNQCKKKVEPSQKIKEIILKKIEEIPPAARKNITVPSPLFIFEPVGCKECNNTGYAGRIAVFEILSMTERLAEIIQQDPAEAKIAEEGKRQGMITMEQDGILKVLKGITSIEEILRVTEEQT